MVMAPLKTKLGIVVIDDDREKAKERINQVSRGMPEEQIKEFLITVKSN